MSEIYPKISEGTIKPSESETFRLHKVNEIKAFFENEIDQRIFISKKIKLKIKNHQKEKNQNY